MSRKGHWERQERRTEWVTGIHWSGLQIGFPPGSNHFSGTAVMSVMGSLSPWQHHPILHTSPQHRDMGRALFPFNLPVLTNTRPTQPALPNLTTLLEPVCTGWWWYKMHDWYFCAGFSYFFKPPPDRIPASPIAKPFHNPHCRRSPSVPTAHIGPLQTNTLTDTDVRAHRPLNQRHSWYSVRVRRSQRQRCVWWNHE